jgi:hypothetical protein
MRPLRRGDHRVGLTYLQCWTRNCDRCECIGAPLEQHGPNLSAPVTRTLSGVEIPTRSTDTYIQGVTGLTQLLVQLHHFAKSYLRSPQSTVGNQQPICCPQHHIHRVGNHSNEGDRSSDSRPHRGAKGGSVFDAPVAHAPHAIGWTKFIDDDEFGRKCDRTRGNGLCGNEAESKCNEWRQQAPVNLFRQRRRDACVNATAIQP